jgi:hypothetical protein
MKRFSRVLIELCDNSVGRRCVCSVCGPLNQVVVVHRAECWSLYHKTLCSGPWAGIKQHASMRMVARLGLTDHRNACLSVYLTTFYHTHGLHSDDIQDEPLKCSPGQGQQHAIEDGQRWGGGEMLTARLLTNCSITQRNILTPERI